MRVADFDYELPEDLIAQHPAADRAGSRMLVMDRARGRCELRSFPDLLDYLRAGDCLVVNDTRVIPARLLGRRQPGGGRVEALLLEAVSPAQWRCLLRPGGRLRLGEAIAVETAPDHAFTLMEKKDDGTFVVQFDTPDVNALLAQAGRVPLPPYIRRTPDTTDADRYQTVYAKAAGAVAAPTAGLHFTPEILARLRARGVSTASVTLHVGPGTFQPVKADPVEAHHMHEEAYVLPEPAAAAINATRARGGLVVAVGTTSVRVLETCADPATRTVRAGAGRTRIFLHPPYCPVIPDLLLTNFHLPRSTLLMLVSTFSALDNVLAAYRLAVRERLRFYSYGDCMLLVPAARFGRA